METLALQVLELMEGGDLRSALSGPLAGYNSWYNNGRVLAMDIVRGVFYLHGELSCLTGSPHLLQSGTENPFHRSCGMYS